MNIYRWCSSDRRWEQVACLMTSDWARVVHKGLQLQRPNDHFYCDHQPPWWTPDPSKKG